VFAYVREIEGGSMTIRNDILKMAVETEVETGSTGSKGRRRSMK